MRRMICFALVICCPLLQAQNDNYVEMSVAEAENIFMMNNFQLLAEHYEIDKADAAIVQSKLFDNPVVSFEQNVYNRLNGKYFDFGSKGQSAVEIEQLIYIAGQRSNKIKLEKYNRKRNEYLFEESVRVLKNELKLKFISLYYRLKEIDIYDSEIKSLQNLLTRIKQEEEKGNISLLERTRIESYLLSLESERNDVANDIVSLRGNVKLLMGGKCVSDISPVINESLLNDFDMGSVPYSELEGFVMERPDMKLAKVNIQSAETEIKLQRSLSFPEVRVKGIYDKAGNFINDYFAVGINLTLPVFNRNQGNIRIAKHGLAQNRIMEEHSYMNAMNELSNSYKRLENAVGLYDKTDKEIELNMEKLTKGLNESLIAKNISIIEFIDFYEAYKNTSLNTYKIRKDVFMAMEDINYITNHNVFRY